MKTRSRLHRSPTARRGGFTLMELMVVVTIIGALMALAASAVVKYMGVQQESNTKTLLAKTQSQLSKAWSKVKDQARNETIPPAVYTMFGNTDANVNGRVQVIYIKLKMRQAFPMNFAEALNVQYNNPELASWGLSPIVPLSPLPPLPAYVSYLASFGIKSVTFGGTIGGPTYTPQPYESSVCLLMALQRGVSGAGIDPSTLTAGGATGNINGLPYLTDAWGRAIFFSRFPTGSTTLNPSGPSTGANDPGDPLAYLNSPVWNTLTVQQSSFSALTLQHLAPPSTPPLSYKLAPMVASGGGFNWEKTPLAPPAVAGFDPITFAPLPGSAALFSNP